jgi:hypothetical protein
VAFTQVKEMREIPEAYRNFDIANVRQWAGPDHWKFPSASRPATSSALSGSEKQQAGCVCVMLIVAKAGSSAAEGKPKTKKERLFFDFTSTLRPHFIFSISFSFFQFYFIFLFLFQREWIRTWCFPRPKPLQPSRKRRLREPKACPILFRLILTISCPPCYACLLSPNGM